MNWLKNLFAQSSTEPNAAVESMPVEVKLKQTSSDPAMLVADEAQSRAGQNLTVAELKQFIPLRELDENILLTLPHASLRYPKDALLFILDQPCDHVFYLVKGILHMQPAGEYGYLIGEDTVRARLPLNSGRFFGATAQAVSDVEVLEIPAEFNSLWIDQHHDETSHIELSDIQLPAQMPNKAFFDGCVLAYRDNTLTVPSLPDIAMKLNKSMQTEMDIKDVVAILHLDPRIVTKLIQVANSPIYATATPISNCQDAVARIGLNATRNLVLSICLKELFHSKNAELKKGMRQLWKNCVYLSSLCFVLAQECDDVQPEDAMLAGLIADIGAIPLVQFAEQATDLAPSFTDIEQALPYFRAAIGTQVLRNLEFSHELCAIPQQAENWLYDSGTKTTLADIVILAKLHSYFGSDKAIDLPYINSIPAYGKLRDGKLNPDFSLSVLHDAQSRVRAAMQLLS